MATIKRDGKWYIKGRIQKEDGTYYQYTKLARGCKYVDEAREYETEFVKRWQAIQVAKYNKTFAELAEECLAQAVNVKAVTIRTDQDIVDKCNKVFGKKKINLFNKEYLQKFIKGLEEKYSKSYVSKYYYTINKIFKYAVDEDYIVINPMTKVRRSAFKDEVKKEMLFWEPSEFEIFIRYVKNPEMQRFYVFLYYMGTRKGEAQALQWKDVDFDKNTIRIYKTVTNKIKGKAWEITSPKTQNSMRTIIMPSSANCLLASSIILATVLFPNSDSSVGSEAHPPILKSIAALKNTANSFFIFFSLHTVILLHYITKKRITKYLLAYNILS